MTLPTRRPFDWIQKGGNFTTLNCSRHTSLCMWTVWWTAARWPVWVKETVARLRSTQVFVVVAVCSVFFFICYFLSLFARFSIRRLLSGSLWTNDLLKGPHRCLPPQSLWPQKNGTKNPPHHFFISETEIHLLLLHLKNGKESVPAVSRTMGWKKWQRRLQEKKKTALSPRKIWVVSCDSQMLRAWKTRFHLIVSAPKTQSNIVE